MKIMVVVLLMLAVICQASWGQQPTVQEEQAAIRRQIEEMQRTIDELKQKLDAMEAVTTDPKGKLETVRGDVEKLKKIKSSGYVQTRYEWFSQKEDGGVFTDGFNVRRARVKVTAKPTSNTQAIIQLEAAKNSVSVKDAYLGYTFADDKVFTIGQFHWPFGFEVPYSSSRRETPERALAFRRLFPGERDRGAKVDLPIGKNGVATLGAFDGTGIEQSNTLIIDPQTGTTIGKTSTAISGDQNNHKDIVGRLAWNRGNIEYGVSSYFGEGVWNNGYTGFLDEVDKNRYGADFRYYGDKWTFKTEYVRGKGVDGAATSWDQEESIDGYYTQLNFNPGIADTLVARYAALSDDPVKPTFGRRTSWDLGWIHALNDKTRVKLFYKINDEKSSEIDNNGYTLEWLATY